MIDNISYLRDFKRYPTLVSRIGSLFLVMAHVIAGGCKGDSPPDAGVPADAGSFSDAADLLLVDGEIPDAGPAPKDASSPPDLAPSSADAGWVPINRTLRGGNINFLEAAPSSPGTFYACTTGSPEIGWFGSVFKTSDGAKHWMPINRGLPGRSITSLVVAPADSKVAYAATDQGLYKTADGGGSWTSIFRGRSVDLAINPQDASELYMTNDRLFKSSDAGRSWTELTNPCHLGEALRWPVFAPSRPTRICALSGLDSLRICCSDDSGMTWGVVSTFSNPIGAMAFDPRDSDVILVGSAKGVLRTTDGGKTWKAAGGPRFPQQIAFDPRAPQNVSAAGYVEAGVFLSSDGGATFGKVALPLVSWSTAWDPADPQKVVVGGGWQSGTDLFDGHEPIWTSADGGKTWSPSGDGLTGFPVYSLAIDPQKPNSLWASYGWRQLAVQSSDRGATWKPTGTGLENAEVHGLFVDPDDSARVYAATEKGIRVTTNGGASWMTATSLPAYAIAAAHGTALAVTAPGYMNAFAEPALTSMDRGLTWTNDNCFPWTNWAIWSHVVPWQRQIILDPRDPAAPYVVNTGLYRRNCGPGESPNIGPPGWSDFVVTLDAKGGSLYAGSRNGAVVKSDDGGNTWTEVHPSDGCRVYSILADSNQAGTVYAGTCHGVWKTSDGGKAWRPTFADTSTTFMTTPVITLAMDPTDSKTIYAGTAVGGIFKTVSGGD